MKNEYFLFLITLALFSFRSDNEIKDYLNVKGPINFDDQSFRLKWSQKNGNYYVQEYFTDGESLEKFNKMISLFVLDENISIEDAVAIKKQELEEFKKTDPVCNYAITKSDDNTVLIDFLRGESEGDRMTIVEFNLYRYKQIKIGKNKKALIVYAFAERAYGAEITPFMKSLKDVRFDYIHKIFQIEIPDIELID